MPASSNPCCRDDCMTRISPIIFEDVAAILGDLDERLNPLAGTTILITGANGFLCSYLIDTVAAWNRRHAKTPCRIIALDNLKAGLSDRLEHLTHDPYLTVKIHDIALPLAVDGPVDWIIHGASTASPVIDRQHPLETIDAHVGGTRHVLELAREKKAGGVVLMSSSAVYGDPDPAFIPTPEDYRGSVSCTGPRAHYEESKRVAETLGMTYHRLYDSPVKMVRPFNVFGPGQRLDDQRIMPDLLSAALKRRPLTLLGDGRASRSFCYVSDAVQAIWHILLGPVAGQSFNVGNDESEISIEGLAAAISEAAGPPYLEIRRAVRDDKSYVADRPQRRSPDLTKLRRLYPWQSKIALREGIARTLQSYRLIAAPERIAASY